MRDMTDILLKIIGRQDDTTDCVELVTEGEYKEKDGVVYLSYNETDFSGVEGCVTHLTIDDDKVLLNRTGDFLPIDPGIEFSKGKRSEGLYSTPFGPIEMEVLTNELIDKISRKEREGSLFIDYNFSLRGLSGSRSYLDIEIKRKKDES